MKSERGYGIMDRENREEKRRRGDEMRRNKRGEKG